jgi:hypothetical protein
MSRGFLKTIAGKKRLRFVKPGYDADDLNVPLNKVIFDSEIEGCLQTFRAGSVTLTPPYDGFVVTWPDLGYTPFATLSFGGPGNATPALLRNYTSTTIPRFETYPTGLYVKLPNGSAVIMNYRVFRLKVQ